MTTGSGTPHLIRPTAKATPTSARILDALAVQIDNVLDAHHTFGASTRWTELTESPAAEERRLMRRQYGPGERGRLDWTDEPVTYAAGTASTFTAVAAQHLEAIAKLVRAREVMFSIPPLARAVLEIAGHLHWMLCPFQSEEWTIRDRAARVFLIQIADKQRAQTAAKSLGHPGVSKLVERYKHHRNVELRRRFWPSEIGYSDAGDLHLRDLQHRMPGLSESVTWIEKVHKVDWQIGGAYALLSNASHPTFTHVQELMQDNGASVHFGLEDATFPYRLVRMSVFTFLETWKLTAAYLGHGQRQMVDLMNDFDTDVELVSVR